jgi:hypothetical protein
MRSRWNQALCCALLPALERQPIIDTLHRDAVLHRTDQRAEVAADAMMLIDTRDALKRRNTAAATEAARIELGNRCSRNSSRRLRLNHRRRACSVRRGRCTVKVDALMRSIPARRVAKLASNTQILMNPGNDLIVQIELLPFPNIGER